MQDTARGEGAWAVPTALLAGVALLVLTLLFWKFRIFDTGVNPTIEVGPVDLYVEIAPMNRYGFEALRHGYLPLWNPYQLCGGPFLAAFYVGLLYPPHWVNLFFDVFTSFEISLILHMFFGGFSMWWLCRHFGVGALGGLTAAVTFMWSGWMIHNNISPVVFEQLTWMPLTVLLLDRVLSGFGLAWLWWPLAIACQLALGAMEVFLHTLYLAALFGICRVAQLSWRDGGRVALRRSGTAALGAVAGAMLAAPQLLPALELVRQSTRSAGNLSWAQVVWPAVPQLLLARLMIEVKYTPSVGVLALFGLVLALGYRRYRLVWVFAAVALTFAVSLMAGGTVYRFYYSIPLVGGLFRHPWKFLSIYSFAMALLVGVGVSHLQEWATLPRRVLWTRARWLLLLAVGLTALSWLTWMAPVPWFWKATAALLLLFGAAGGSRLRSVAVVGVCVVQAASLFFTVSETHVRPVKQPEIFETHKPLLESLKRNLGDARVFLSGSFLFWPNLTSKQGSLMKMPVVNDYEPLAVGRYRTFFETISPPTDARNPFYGYYALGPTSRWRLMDLTGVQYFVMLRGEPGDLFMSQNRTEYRPVYDVGGVRAYEKQHVLPHAYFVSHARVLDDPKAVLVALDDPSFDPRSQVILEGGAAMPLAAGVASAADVQITRYTPEDVEISVDAGEPGYLVLTDLLYPGWRAYVGDREVPIQQANYLFRAVHLASGHSRVRFEFRPASFRLGLALSATTALLLVATAVWTRRRPTLP